MTDLDPPIAAFVTLTPAEYNQLIATLMEARGWFDARRRKGTMWPGAPEGLLADAQRMLAVKLATPSQPPVAMMFGQPWDVIKERLPSPLVAEVEAWIASKERDETPPSGLVQRLYDAYLKAKIEVFPR